MQLKLHIELIVICLYHLFQKSQCFEWHANDFDDTYIWQIQGETKWKLQMSDTNKDNVDTAILEPNDMIYIPHRKMHH